MIHRKVRIPCGLFDTTGPGYGRAKYRMDGPLHRGPSERMDTPQRSQMVEYAAIADRRRHLRDCARHPGLAGAQPGIPRLVDNRPARFTNRPTWAKEMRPRLIKHTTQAVRPETVMMAAFKAALFGGA